jgi:hypothetical protein
MINTARSVWGGRLRARRACRSNAGIVEDVEAGSPELVSRGLHCGAVRDLELDADSLNEATLHSSAPKQACTT